MAGKKDMVRFTVSLPEALLGELDRRVITRGYQNRSEYVRDLIREQLLEDHWRSGRKEMVGVLTITYDHHQRHLTERLMDLQHNRFVNVLCTTHVHLDHDTCLEAIILKGRPTEIERLSKEIGGLKGVRLAKLTRATRLDY